MDRKAAQARATVARQTKIPEMALPILRKIEEAVDAGLNALPNSIYSKYKFDERLLTYLRENLGYTVTITDGSDYREHSYWMDVSWE